MYKRIRRMLRIHAHIVCRTIVKAIVSQFIEQAHELLI